MVHPDDIVFDGGQSSRQSPHALNSETEAYVYECGKAEGTGELTAAKSAEHRESVQMAKIYVLLLCAPEHFKQSDYLWSCHS